jgi:hypothetical protein
MPKLIQIDLNRIDHARIDTRIRRDGSEARFYSFILADSEVVDEYGNNGECFEKLTKNEYSKGLRGRLIGYSQPHNFKIKRHNDEQNND